MGEFRNIFPLTHFRANDLFLRSVLVTASQGEHCHRSGCYQTWGNVHSRGTENCSPRMGWTPKEMHFRRLPCLKAHDFNKRVIKNSCHGCYDSIFPEILPLVNSKHRFLKHLLGTCPTRSAGTAKLKCAVRERGLDLALSHWQPV